jgi:type II secretory pathway component PulF
VAAEFLARAMHGIISLDMPLREALDRAEQGTKSDFISAKWADAKKKVEEAADPASALSQAVLVDDVAITSLGR